MSLLSITNDLGVQDNNLENVLVLNKNMRIEDLRNMLKDSNKELITMNGFKSTVYLKSLVALEHDPDVRLKNSQREAAASESHNYLQQGRSKKPTGIRYSQYAEMFTHARPALFNMLLGFFSGHSCWQILPKLEFADDIHFVISTLLKLFNINRQKKVSYNKFA